MELKKYEIDSDLLTEEESDYDLDKYEDGSTELMGAHYAYQLNSLTRIEAALKKTTSSERLRNIIEKQFYSDVYRLLINEPRFMKDVKESMKCELIKSWDECNLLELYTDKIMENLYELKDIYPDSYMEIMHRLLPDKVASYYDQVLSEEQSSDRSYDYDISEDDIQFQKFTGS